MEELDLPSVSSDNYKGAYEAVNYLIENNHRNIGFIGAKNSDVVHERYKGYCRALLDNSIPLKSEFIITKFNSIVEDEPTILKEEDANNILQSLVSNKVTAIFCVNDLIANIIMKVAKDTNISIPDDISIIGFDHIQFENIPYPNLTSVAQNFDLIAKETVNLLINRIRKPKEKNVNSIIVPTKLYKGNTVKSI